MAVAEGQQKEQSLRDAGFSDTEIDDWKGKAQKDLGDAGFSGQEIRGYFGVKDPNMAPISKYINGNLDKWRAAEGMKPDDQGPPTSLESLPGPVPISFQSGMAQANPEQKPAKTLIDAIEAGFQMSVTGLIARGQKPDVILPQEAPMYQRIAAQLGTIAGDIPAMAVGSAVGTPAGAAAGTAILPGPGTVVGAAMGAGAGAMALPAGMRTALMQHYEKGDIHTFSDFWERSAAIFLTSLKAGAVGAVTAGVGGTTAKFAGTLEAPVAAKTAGVLASEIATMTTVGSALEGHAPNAQDFLESAIMLGGLKAGMSLAGKATPHAEMIAGKLRDIYEKTGIKPDQVAQHAQEQPTVMQDLLSSNIQFPKAYEPMIEKANAEGNAVAVGPPPPEMETVKASAELSKKNNTLSDEFGQPRELQVEKAPEAKASTEEPPALSPEEAAVSDRITSASPAKSKLTFDEFYTKVVDNFHPIKQFENALVGKKILSTQESPYENLRLTRGAFGKADQFLEFSPFKFDSLENTGTKSLKAIAEPFKEDLDGLNRYMVSARTVELAGRGIESGVPLEAAKTVVAQGKGKYEKAFGEMVKFQNDTLSYLKDSGVLSEKSYAAMADANKSYVPFYRLMGDEGTSGAKAAGMGLNVRNPVREIQGSERKIVDPLESIVKNTYLYITLAERNRALVKMAELAESSPEGGVLMKKVPTPMQKIDVKSEEVNRFLGEHGIDANADEGFGIFRPQSKQLGPNEMALYRDGKREIYEVAPEIADVLKGMDRESMGVFMKILSFPAKALRAGSALSPDFIARNLIRDTFSAFNLADGVFTPLNTLRGLGSLLKKDDSFQNWLKSGGANSAMVSIDRDYIEQNVFKLSKETGLIDKTWNVMKSPLEMLRVTSELIENATRLGEFKRITDGDTSAANIFAGGMASREVTLDFQRMGANTRAVNMITAFWNAQVQGVDKAIRTLQERPLETGAKLTASITIPSLLLWWANKDDPRWQEIPRWQKDLFWIVMTKDNIYRIPKPNELGLMFGSLPERTMEAFFTDHPHAYKDFASSMGQAFAPGYIPTFATPIIEQFANRSTFTGSPIVSHQMEGILPEYQYNEYTSEAGKMLGKFVGAVPGMRENGLASPAVIENYIRAWSGNMGKYALSMADAALTKAGVVPDPVKPTATLADLPVVKAFAVRFPSATAQSIQDFQDRYQSQKKVIDTIRYLAKNGDVANAAKEMALAQSQDKLFNLDGIRESLSTQNKFVRMVYKNPDIKPDEKRQLIDGVYYSMIESAKAGNKMMDELEKSVKSAH